MQLAKTIIVCLALGTLATVSLPILARAEAGNFWYGLYNVQWGPNSPWPDSVWAAMANTYKMNWALTAINESDTAGGVLDDAHAAGINIMQWFVKENGLPDDSALFGFRYGNSNYVRLQAEGDSLNYYWQCKDIESPYYPGTWQGTFVREPAPGYGSGRVWDAALGDSVWHFAVDQVHRPNDSIFTIFWGDLNRHPDERGNYRNFFRVRLRAQTSGCTGEIARLVVRRDLRFSNHDLVEDSAKYWEDLDTTSIPCSQLSDGAYHTFEVEADASNNDGIHVFLFWNGTRDIWVDWMEVGDAPGTRLSNEQGNSEVNNYINRYKYGGPANGVIGFYLREELWEEANVWPQYYIDTLVEQAGLKTLTEHHYVAWWPERNQYGERNAITARLQKGTPVSGMFYPFTGYHFRPAQLPDPLGRRSIDTVQGIVPGIQGDTCPAQSDTLVCFQERMDSLAAAFALYKGLSDSTQNKFVPFLQVDSWVERAIDTCANDTNPPWKVGLKVPTEGEVKFEASLALANGANGLLYWVFGNHYYDYIAKQKYNCCPGPCDTAYNWMAKKDWIGFVGLPESRAALHSFVGPLVDSLGSFFYDADWLGAGRVDPYPDTGAVASLFDSVQSLTLDPGTSAYIHAGVYELASQTYFLLVNRRAYDTSAQTIRTWLNLSSGMYYVIDMYSYDTVLTGTLAGGGIPFTTTLPPGEAKLFKIVPGPVSIAGTAFPSTWQGGIAVGGNVTVDANRSLAILGPAQVRVDSGGSYAFEVYGNLIAQGSIQDTIRFLSGAAAPGRSDWYGIRQLGPGNVALAYAQIKNAYSGLRMSSISTIDTVSVDRCDFRQCQFGLYMDANASSDVLITNSHFSKFSSSAIYVYRGVATVQGNRFTDSLLFGVLVGGSSNWTSGAMIVGNTFDSLKTNNAYGIYLQTVSNDGFPAGAVTIEDNTFGPTWPVNSTQGAMQISNCSDSISVYRNRVYGKPPSLCTGTDFRPTYGIFAFSTRLRLNGDLNSAESLSTIRYAKHGLFCVSSSQTDPDFPVVREMSFKRCYKGAYVYSNSKVNLGTDSTSDKGNNAFHGYLPCGYYCGCDIGDSYTVHNANGSFIVPARGNYWKRTWCGDEFGDWDACWPDIYDEDSVDHSGKRSSNPFTVAPLGKAVADEIAAHEPIASEAPVRPDPPENYPNPFNSSTVIKFSLATSGHVTVRIFNVLGQHVRTLSDGHREAGRQSVAWNGSNENGDPVSSGVYFYRIETPDAQFTKKMVIVK